MRAKKMLVCGRSAQKGLYTACKPSALNATGCWPPFHLSSISLVTSGLCESDDRGSPQFLALTRHLGHRFSLQHATKHCSGKSATYAVRIG